MSCSLLPGTFQGMLKLAPLCSHWLQRSLHGELSVNSCAKVVAIIFYLSFQSAKARLKVRMEELKKLEWEHEVLKQRFEQTQSERDELYGKFVKAIHEVQQKSNFKNLLLEKKLTALADTLEKKVCFFRFS